MTRPTDEQLLAFLEGRMGDSDRERLLDQLAGDPELAGELRLAASGLEAMIDSLQRQSTPANVSTRISPWWAVAASIATLAISIPVTLSLAKGTTGPQALAEASAVIPTGIPEASDPSFMLVLHGRWPDAAAVSQTEARRRADEYWAWTTALAEERVLLAAGDLRWEPGERLGPQGVQVEVSASELDAPDYVVGMYALRVSTYAEALALARACPHLRYGGTVSIRQVGAGFVTDPGMGDWTD